MRILFVDDDELVITALRRTVRNEPYTFLFTTDPDDVLHLVVEERIDVVISDESMPSMNGNELFGLLRRLHPHVLRVMLTGQNDRDTAMKAINEGQVHRFLDKPWGPEQLREVLRELDARVRAERAVVTAKSADAAPSIQREHGVVILEEES